VLEAGTYELVDLLYVIAIRLPDTVS
jgi:hypothetical protein